MKAIPLRLFHSLSDRVLDSIVLDPEKVSQRGYLDRLCRRMAAEHELAILSHATEPLFYIQVCLAYERIQKEITS